MARPMRVGWRAVNEVLLREEGTTVGLRWSRVDGRGKRRDICNVALAGAMTMDVGQQ